MFQGLHYFISGRCMVQIFQRESIFCRKISSGGSLFIKKLVPGGTNLGESIFTMTPHRPARLRSTYMCTAFLAHKVLTRFMPMIDSGVR